jgi:quinoprotein glucose dehydrogenase
VGHPHGKLAWTFHSIPKAGEKYNDTWAGDSWKNRSGRQRLGPDHRGYSARHRVHAVRRAIGRSIRRRSGRPQSFQFKHRRRRRNTGKYLWHFQLVHHDLWDADVANPPMLIDVKQRGRTVPAVAVVGKMGLLFLLDRVTGKPIYGVEERPVPASEVPLERAAKTQPFRSSQRRCRACR